MMELERTEKMVEALKEEKLDLEQSQHAQADRIKKVEAELGKKKEEFASLKTMFDTQVIISSLNTSRDLPAPAKCSIFWHCLNCFLSMVQTKEVSTLKGEISELKFKIEDQKAAMQDMRKDHKDMEAALKNTENQVRQFILETENLRKQLTTEKYVNHS